MRCAHNKQGYGHGVFPAMFQPCSSTIGSVERELVTRVAQVISEVRHATVHCSDCRLHHQRMRWCWWFHSDRNFGKGAIRQDLDAGSLRIQGQRVIELRLRAHLGSCLRASSPSPMQERGFVSIVANRGLRRDLAWGQRVAVLRVSARGWRFSNRRCANPPRCHRLLRAGCHRRPRRSLPFRAAAASTCSLLIGGVRRSAGRRGGSVPVGSPTAGGSLAGKVISSASSSCRDFLDSICMANVRAKRRSFAVARYASPRRTDQLRSVLLWVSGDRLCVSAKTIRRVLTGPRQRTQRGGNGAGGMNILGLAAGPCGIKDIEQLGRNLRSEVLGLNEVIGLIHPAHSKAT